MTVCGPATRSSWTGSRRSPPITPVRPVAYHPEKRHHPRRPCGLDDHRAPVGRAADPAAVPAESAGDERPGRDQVPVHPAADLRGRHLDRHRAAGRVRALPRCRSTGIPPITPPSVQVSAVYPGATAEDVADAVAAPIEQQLSGLDGLLYFKSSNASDGTMNLQVYFDLSRDLDLAAVDVQNQVSLAEPQLPQEVVRQGITITKAQTDILAVIGLSSKDPRYDATYLNNYARIYIIDELKRIPGVGRRPGHRLAPVLDAAEPRSGPHGPARPHGGGRPGGGAGAEHDQSGRPDRPGAGAAGKPADRPGDDARPAHRSQGVRRHHRPGRAPMARWSGSRTSAG